MNSFEQKVITMLQFLDEKQKRIYLANEANAYGIGGVKRLHEITGVSQTTIIRGKKELAKGIDVKNKRVRCTGGGRKTALSKDKNIKIEIEKIVANSTFGDPEQVIYWTSKSLRNIQGIMKSKGYSIGYNIISRILKESGYSLQLNQKNLQTGKEHIDRNGQFEYINEKAKKFISQGNPVISVDTKKKENIGNFKNSGVEYAKTGEPTKVFDHDFPLKELGKVSPYGIYDIDKNIGFVNLGISSDTAEFAVESITRWWVSLGKNTYPQAKEIYINCDGGGSNGSRVKLWKAQLQDFSDLTGLSVHVSHFPPGTSKWNKIEHKMFCFISKNWRGKPLIDIETVVNLIGNTSTEKGLKIICVKDENQYQIGTKVSDSQFENINIKKEQFHGEWNYIISPKK